MILKDKKAKGERLGWPKRGEGVEAPLPEIKGRKVHIPKSKYKLLIK